MEKINPITRWAVIYHNKIHWFISREKARKFVSWFTKNYGIKNGQTYVVDTQDKSNVIIKTYDNKYELWSINDWDMFQITSEPYLTED